MKLEITIPKNKKFDVVGMGMNAIDHLITVPSYPSEDTKTRMSGYEIQGGGQMGTGLTQLQRLGAKTKYLGKVGDDWQGELSLKLLRDEGADVSSVIKVENCKNQFAIIIVNENTGTRTIITHRPPELKLRVGDFSRESVTSGKILFVDGSGADCALQAVRWANQEKIPVVMDVERIKDKIPEMMDLADIVIASRSFAEEVCPGKDYKQFLKYLNDTYNTVFSGITLGERGSMGYTQGRFIEVPAYPVKVKDTTGAGDIYHAAFVYGTLQQWDVEKIMKFSSAAAALKCRHVGGRKGAPGLDEVLGVLKGLSANCKKIFP